MGKRMAAGALALALVAAACGDDDEASSAEPEATPTAREAPAELTADERAFLDTVGTTSRELFDDVESGFQEVFARAETASSEELLPQLAVVIAAAIELQDTARTEFAALDPPDRFADDHERLLRFVDDRRAVWVRQAEAAAALDGAAMDELDRDRRSLERAVLAEVSFTFGEAIAISADELATLSDLGPAELAYIDVLGEAFSEFTRRAGAFSEALEQSYASEELLLQALLDAGAGEAYAAVRDAAVDIEPPPSYEAAHERFLAFIDETVRLDTIIGDAARAGDVVAFEVANVQLSIVGGMFSLDAPPELVEVVGGDSYPAPDAIEREETGYAGALFDATRTFRVLALDAPVSSGIFPQLTDDAIRAAIIEVEPEYIGFTQDAVAALDALDPPADYVAGHDRLRTYLADLVEMRTTAHDAATAGDDAALEQLGYLGDLLIRDRAEVGLWCDARADLLDDPVLELLGPFFEPFGPIATIPQLCPV